MARRDRLESHCSCLCEVAYERALIINRAESETHTVYIIQEHIVKEEAGLKHEITSASASHRRRKASADAGGKDERGSPQLRFNNYTSFQISTNSER